MNTEKVKELKDYIQKSADLGQYYMLAGGKITMMEVVDYINELEKEKTEQLKQFAERLKEKAYQVHDGYFEVLTGLPAIAVDIVVLENLLDETLKEFTE